MGGDFAPRHVVDGALAAVRHFDLGVLLVGPAATLEAELSRYPDVDRERVRIVDAPDVVSMEESPSAALRRKPGASIKVAAETVGGVPDAEPLTVSRALTRKSELPPALAFIPWIARM